MMAGYYLAFCDTDGPTAWAIRAATRSRWCHVASVMPDGTVYEARARGGVQVSDIDTLLGRYPRWQIASIGADLDAAAEWLRAQVGKPYDWTAIAGFWWPGRRWQEADAWYCAEHAAAGSVAGHLPLVDADAWRVTPQDLHQSVAVHKSWPALYLPAALRRI